MSDYPPKLIMLLDILRARQPFALRIGDAIILAEALLEEWKGIRERVRLAEDAIANVESALNDFDIFHPRSLEERVDEALMSIRAYKAGRHPEAGE